MGFYAMRRIIDAEGKFFEIAFLLYHCNEPYQEEIQANWKFWEVWKFIRIALKAFTKYYFFNKKLKFYLLKNCCLLICNVWLYNL